MNLEEFKIELISAQKRTLKIGINFFIISSTIATLVVIFAGYPDRSTIIGLSITGVFVMIGFLMMFTSLNWIRNIKSGEHELIRAIENKSIFQDYVVWVYQSIMITEHQTISMKTKNYHLVVFKSDGKFIQFMPTTETQVQAMIKFLSNEFPKAIIGYSEENRKLVSERMGKEIRR